MGDEDPSTAFPAAPLVSCLRSSYAKSRDIGEDLVRGLDPCEGLGVIVMGGQKETDGVLESAGAAVSPSAELLLGEQSEPTLHLVDPGGVGRREMEMKPCVAKKPAPDEWSLMGPVVVEDKMDVEVDRHLAVNAVEKAPEFNGAMSSMSLTDDLAGRDVKCGKQRRGAMSSVVMSPTLGCARTHREDRLSAVQRLDLALLVDTEHERSFGWAQVEADNVSYLLDKLRVVGESEGLGSVRLQTEGVPDPQDARIADAAGGGHAAGTPMSGITWSRFQSLHDNSLDLLVTNLPGSTRSGFIEQAGQAPLNESVAPFPNGLAVEAQLFGNLDVRVTVGAAQDDARALGQPMTGLRPPTPLLESNTILIGDDQAGLGRTSSWYGIYLDVCGNGYPLIIPRISEAGH